MKLVAVLVRSKLQFSSKITSASISCWFNFNVPTSGHLFYIHIYIYAHVLRSEAAGPVFAQGLNLSNLTDLFKRAGFGAIPQMAGSPFCGFIGLHQRSFPLNVHGNGLCALTLSLSRSRARSSADTSGICLELERRREGIFMCTYQFEHHTMSYSHDTSSGVENAQRCLSGTQASKT